LTVELSGLWFLVLRKNRVFALAASPDSQAEAGVPQTLIHHPRLFVSNEHMPQGGQNDVDPAFRKYDIEGDMAWPTTMQMVDQAELPVHITNFTKLKGYRFNEAEFDHSVKVPLSFDTPCEEFPDTTFRYQRQSGGQCSWQGTDDARLAWKLVYKATVPGDEFPLDFPGAPKHSLKVKGDELKLIIRNTTEKFSRAADPDKTNHDDDKDAHHFLEHYKYLEPISGMEKCYPVRTSKALVVSGLYTCMPGGGS
jgi:hypothetical protein